MSCNTTMTKKDIEAVCHDLIENIKITYMASDEDTNTLELRSQSIIEACNSDNDTMDGFKNLLFGMYKYCVYESYTYPFFSCEDEFVMLNLESLIRTNYGNDFLNNHRLEQTHWVYADGTYSYLFTQDFVDTVY